MRRPTRSVGKAAKKPRLKGTAVRRSTRVQSATSSDLQARVDALERELTEAREQQSATSEVLEVISRSPGDLQPVFQAMLENAARVCEAKFGVLFRYGEGAFHAAAT